MRGRLTEITRSLAKALSDPGVRQQLLGALRSSRFRENKVHLGALLRSEDTRLLGRIAQETAQSPAGVFALDVAPELGGPAVRAAVRGHPGVRFLITCADPALVEEVHFGATAEEAARIRRDISWIWGPPEDHLATLYCTLGLERFAFGTQLPVPRPGGGGGKAPADRLSVMGTTRQS